MTIPVSVIIVTKNEEKNIGRCLSALNDFDDVWVVDSGSSDRTCAIAQETSAQFVNFQWNGCYPKKRQWCLDNLPLRYKWVFFVDADEVVPDALQAEIAQRINKDKDVVGFFITGRYCLSRSRMRFGMINRKIALFHSSFMHFPVVDDLDIPGMGEIEGHYQPILNEKTDGCRIETLKLPLLHYALDDEHAWGFRHEKYARWEAGMNKRGAWPIDPVPWRQTLKKFLRERKTRPYLVFLWVYIFRGGFLDGPMGYHMAKLRFRYLRRIQIIEAGLKV